MLEALTDNTAIACPGNWSWQEAPKPAPFVADEVGWRLPSSDASPMGGSTIRASRWRTLDRQSRECSARAPEECYIVKVLLRSTNLHLRVQGKTIQNGVAPPGTFHITEPAAHATALFRGPYDILHIRIPDRLMSECAAGLPHQAGLPGLMSAFAKDTVVESLARALLDADGPPGEFNGLYVDSIGVALVARLLHATRQSDKGDRPKIAELSRWRLKRAIDLIEAGLDRSLTLAEIAAASGLSRMHFAAQFRAATGLRPHEFLLRRRVERAQELLAGSDQPIVDIALSVGFQTQSHFTTLFKRYVGHTPQTWRRCHATR